MTKDWRDEAACAVSDPELFFSNGSFSGMALRICNEYCSVREECLQAALEEEAGATYRHGLRGGLNGGQRRELAKEVA